jgi:hypothetical protein
MSDPRDDLGWEGRLGQPPPADPGFTLRVLTALPPVRRPRERLRTRVLLLALLIAAVLMAVTAMPVLAEPTRLLPALIVFLVTAALALWSVLTVAD